jgi:hypothetical protein
MTMLVFCVVTLCRLVSRYQHFGGTYCLHLHMTSQPRRPTSTSGRFCSNLQCTSYNMSNVLRGWDLVKIFFARARTHTHTHKPMLISNFYLLCSYLTYIDNLLFILRLSHKLSIQPSATNIEEK